MKKVSLTFVIALFAMITFSVNAADQAPVEQSINHDSEDLALAGLFGDIEAGAESACSVQTNCVWGAPPVSCTGSSSCSNGTACFGLPYVTCDGQNTYCSRDWCETTTCCSHKTCDYWCQAHGMGPVGGCNWGCCYCAGDPF